MTSGNKRLTPFGKYVSRALVSRDMSKSALAETVGTSPQYLSYILYGKRSGEKYVPSIIAALGLDPGKAEKLIA
jgi:transcriptional regulator with XRE-family HTH domain